MKRSRPPDVSKLRTTSLARRKSLVHVRDFGRVPRGDGAVELINSLPDIHGGRDLRTVIREIVRAHRRHGPVVVAMGGHVVKCGLGPYLVDLVERGVITAVCMNGGASIHDYEISVAGHTSEDVEESLEDGSFGMAFETADAFIQASAEGGAGSGLGRALGGLILRNKHKHLRKSILATCARRGVPVTVHLAIGADVTHVHPEVSGQALGESTLIDFRILCGVVANLDGGVWMNVGSAVVLPEVFLKAVSVARNLGYKVKDFAAVNVDILQHYRPRKNVLERPGGRALSLTGQHEILIPLIHAGVRAVLAGKRIR